MISLFFLSLLFLTFLWNRYYEKHWNTGLLVTLRFLQDFVYAGEQAEMTEQIENRKKLVLPVLEVAFHMDKGLPSTTVRTPASAILLTKGISLPCLAISVSPGN